MGRSVGSTNLWGSIASVGLASDFKFSSTVMPFILRGVSLIGTVQQIVLMN